MGVRDHKEKIAVALSAASLAILTGFDGLVAVSAGGWAAFGSLDPSSAQLVSVLGGHWESAAIADTVLGLQFVFEWTPEYLLIGVIGGTSAFLIVKAYDWIRKNDRDRVLA